MQVKLWHHQSYNVEGGERFFRMVYELTVEDDEMTVDEIFATFHYGWPRWDMVPMGVTQVMIVSAHHPLYPAIMEYRLERELEREPSRSLRMGDVVQITSGDNDYFLLLTADMYWEEILPVAVSPDGKDMQI